MSYFSTFYGIEVRDEITLEFTDSAGNVDDMLAGLHEVRARMAEQHPWLKQLRATMKTQDSPSKKLPHIPIPLEPEKRTMSQ